MSDNSPRPLALITGASSGIGAEFARSLAKRGCDLILVARREDKLRKLADDIHQDCDAAIEIFPADLADDNQRHAVADRIRQTGGLEYLVNNAGFGTKERFWQADFASQDIMARLHVLAVMELCHAALGDMVKKGGGNIINTASVAGFFQSPSNVVYCSTKAWIISFTEGLAFELVGSGVNVQALCPGYTLSEFHDVMQISRDGIPKSWWLPANVVVHDSLAALARRKLVCVPGLWRYKLLIAISPFLPRWLKYRVAAARHKRVIKTGKPIMM
ncbi:MAG TPA: SDR family oxidoreductase [Phycisphaerae bacterium]|nr:SDR family oxidoreductase [Phycisphaerae bacterium]HPS52089.1 SDR family oxidoreductase [Phycisphaerae bacterium]